MSRLHEWHFQVWHFCITLFTPVDVSVWPFIQLKQVLSQVCQSEPLFIKLSINQNHWRVFLLSGTDYRTSLKKCLWGDLISERKRPFTERDSKLNFAEWVLFVNKLNELGKVVSEWTKGKIERSWVIQKNRFTGMNRIPHHLSERYPASSHCACASLLQPGTRFPYPNARASSLPATSSRS